MKKLPKLIETLPHDRMLVIQNKLLRTRVPLYLKNVSKAIMSKKSYYSGLNYLLSMNKSRITLYSSSGKLQCYSDRNRSQGDLYMMMRYYYPNITFEEFRVALFKLMNHKKVNSFFCNNINKRIFFKHEEGLRAEPINNHFLSSLTEVDEFKSIIRYEDGIDRDDNYDLFNDFYTNQYDYDYSCDYNYDHNYNPDLY